MKKLTDNLKQILAGLAYQDAAEFLPMREKMKALGVEPETSDGSSTSRTPVTDKPDSRRIALISDGGGAGAPLDYVIATCLHQGARMDLLIHGLADTADVTLLEGQIRNAGIDYRRIPLPPQAVDGVIEYMRNQPSLIFLVAMPDDAIAKILVQEVMPRRAGRVPVPLVLIGNKPVSRKRNQSAA